MDPWTPRQTPICQTSLKKNCVKTIGSYCTMYWYILYILLVYILLDCSQGNGIHLKGQTFDSMHSNQTTPAWVTKN